MTTTTLEYWQVDGTILNTFAYNIATQTGRLTPPDVRRNSLRIPFRPGSKWTPAVPDERMLELSMWVAGCDEDGFVPTDHAQRAEFNRNLRTLQRLFYRPDRELTIVKRVLLPEGTEVHTGKGTYAGGVDPDMTGNTRAELTVDILMSDPWFYGAEVELSITGAEAVPYEGDVDTTRVVLTLPAGARLTDTTNGHWVQNDGDGTATVDVHEWSALIGGSPAWGLISHSGERLWFPMKSGTPTLSASGGTVGVAYQPAYL